LIGGLNDLTGARVKMSKTHLLSQYKKTNFSLSATFEYKDKER